MADPVAHNYVTNARIDFTGDWKAFLLFLDASKFKRNIDRELRRATIQSALMLVKILKTEIAKGKTFEKNAKLTRALKRSNRPLVDELNLRNAINYQLISSLIAEVGVIDGTRSLSTGSKGKGHRTVLEMQKLVEMMEEGYTITVTEKMRAALMIALRSEDTPAGKRSTALRGIGKKNAQETYRVPPRKVLTGIWSRPDVQKQLRINWRDALKRAFQKQGAK